MPGTKAKKVVENLEEPQVVDDASDAKSDVLEVTPDAKSETKNKSQKEPAKPFLLVADLGRSSCKNLIAVDGVMSKGVQLSSIVSRVEHHPEYEEGGFTLFIEEPTQDKDKDGKPVIKKEQQHWVVGDRALQHSGAIAMTDGANNKVDYFHVLLCGVISTIENLSELATGKKSKTLTIDLTTLSIAIPSELKSKLKYCKHLKKNGVKYRLKFTSDQHAFPEGFGAVFTGKKHYPKAEKIVIADLGAGTFQIAEYNTLGSIPTKKSVDAYYSGGGIHTLKREVARKISASGDGSQYLSSPQIDSVLRSSKWVDNKIVAEDFDKNPVDEPITLAIASWLKESPAGFALEELISISRTTPIVFCGGGFCIKPVMGIIEKKILDSGGIKENLHFPKNMGLLGVMGVYEHFYPTEETDNNQLHVIKSEEENQNYEKAA